MKTLLPIIAATVLACPPAYAKKTHSERTQANTPEEELAGFTVLEGFVVELVASEKDGVVNPIDLTFDDAGRLWTQTARMYPLDPVKDIKWNELLRLMDHPDEQDQNPEFKRIKDLYQGKAKGKDDILVLSNLGKGEALEVNKFATGLAIPQSILPYKNGAFVAQGSELFFLEDTDNDGKADKRTPVLTGFGFTDTHTMAHSLVRGPGGWVHFAQGALNKGEIKAVESGESTRIDFSKIARFSLDGKHIELVNAGLNNIWGFQLRSRGEWYLTEANDFGHSVNPAEPGTAFKGIGNQMLRPYQTLLPVLHDFRVGGTGISGLAFSDDSAEGFPREWQDVALLANPITSTINCVRIVRNPDGTVTAEHLPDLLQSEDDWFRPVNIEFGPDGCLYIADWYNKIVSHNELPTTHPDRDKAHGRIWRIRPKAQTERAVPNVSKAGTEELVKHLKSPMLWEKRAAWHQIADRPAGDTRTLVPALVSLAADPSQESSTRIHALWSLESLQHYDAGLITALLAGEDDALQREALRSLVNFGLEPGQVASFVQEFIDSPNAKLRSQAIRTLDELNAASPETIDILVSFCRPSLSGNALGGAYERNFERFLARRALEKYPAELSAYLDSGQAAKQPATHLVWAMQALGDDEVASAFVRLWDQVKERDFTLSDLIIVANMAKFEPVYQVVLPKFQVAENARQIVDLALEKVEDTYSPALGRLLEQPVETLLASDDPSDQQAGLDAVLKFDPPVDARLVGRFLTEPNTLKAIAALALRPQANKASFITILDDPKSPRDTWLGALAALGKTDQAQFNAYAVSRLKEQPADAPALIATLGESRQGTATLLTLLDKKLIQAENLSPAIAERMAAIHPKNPQAISLAKTASKQRDQEKQAAMKRLPALEELAGKQGGDPATGKALFNGMCLSCHIVGSAGRGIAPALDGSAAREPEALLTAILNPDAAVEGAYVLFRVISKQGEIIEGYRKRSDSSGTVISSIDGGDIFIPAGKIARAEFVGSRSFMPGNLASGLPDEMIGHLLAYIRTLK